LERSAVFARNYYLPGKRTATKQTNELSGYALRTLNTPSGVSKSFIGLNPLHLYERNRKTQLLRVVIDLSIASCAVPCIRRATHHAPVPFRRFFLSSSTGEEEVFGRGVRMDKSITAKHSMRGCRCAGGGGYSMPMRPGSVTIRLQPKVA